VDEERQPYQKQMWCDCGGEAVHTVTLGTGTGAFVYHLCERCWQKEKKQERGE